MPITMTPDGPAIRAGGRLLPLVQLKDGTGVLTDDGPILIFDAIRAAFAVSRIVEAAHIEEIEDERTCFSIDTDPEVYEILTGWGAEIENDEEDDPPEVDERHLPKSLPPIGAEPDAGGTSEFPPISSSAPLMVASDRIGERLAKRAEAIAAGCSVGTPSVPRLSNPTAQPAPGGLPRHSVRIGPCPRVPLSASGPMMSSSAAHRQ